MTTLTEAPPISSLGGTSQEAASRRFRRSPEYREQHDRLAPHREIARVVILGRATHGWTQKQLAEALGTTNTAVSRIESGRQGISVDTLRKLANVLGVTFTIDAEGAEPAGADPMINDVRITDAPYASALDLPSIRTLLTQIQAFKLLTRFVARDKRRDATRLEDEVRDLARGVDRFYEVLGRRNWIYHDALSPEKVRELLKLSTDEAELDLIACYQERQTLRLWIVRLGRFPAMQARMPLIEQAESDFHEGRYSAVTQLLLSVMDGFVNDIDQGNRRGLHARDAREMAAWDCVVGHHMGLTRAHSTFIESFRKTSIAEVRELYRHGIVHGMLVNYNNVFVAAKAWNRLFAVADWADSLLKRGEPMPPNKSWRDSLRELGTIRRANKALEQWRPSVLERGAATFDLDEIVTASREYLSSWASGNFGQMAALLSPLLRETSLNATAGQLREDLGDARPRTFAIQRVSRTAAAVTKVDVELDLGEGPTPGTMRWSRCDDTGHTVAPNEEGSWRLITWSPESIWRERRRATR